MLHLPPPHQAFAAKTSSHCCCCCVRFCHCFVLLSPSSLHSGPPFHCVPSSLTVPLHQSSSPTPISVRFYLHQEVMGQQFSHEEVNSEHILYDQHEQDNEEQEEVDREYMDDDEPNVELIFDDHRFDEGYSIDSLEDIAMIELWNMRDVDVYHFHFSDVDVAFEFYNRYAK
ncbi:hypothetical protein PIB30_025198 [Stylosanthes scabra]|uniref:Uncharacterized protein n=1 Tax=Stylosanthes scabra TaxID=79078 RepID=A0ABU6Q9J3_9FABA|nr:hypothetical protein [Stylosanthes scabra]